MNPTPFFGSKISLISKSEIRYEGILYTVDAKESTIALAQVRSFGSEDRVVEKPVPPRDEIFQYIIFRASDIKDLIVDKPPSPALTDPAIIQAHSTTSQPSPFPSSFPQTSAGGPAAGVNAGQSGSGTSTSASSIQQQLQQAGIQSASTAAVGSKSSGGQSSVNAVQHPESSNKQANKPNATSAQIASSSSGSQSHQGSKTPGGQKQLPQRTSNQLNRQQQQQQQASTSSSQQNNRHDGSSGGAFMNRQNNFTNRRMNINQSRGGGQMNGFQQRNGGFQRTSFSNRFQNQHGGHRQTGGISGFSNFNRRQTNRNFVSNRNVGHHTKPTLNLPDSDFDFEKALDEFKQLEEKLAGLRVNGDSTNVATSSDAETSNSNSEQTNAAPKTEVDASSKEGCYNKEKSFFDQISCEALEREKGNVQRVDWKAERKLNRETFGVVAPMRRNNGYRPNNRFGGYRGHQHNYRSRSGQRANYSGGYTANKPQQNGVPNSNASSTANNNTTAVASTSAAAAAAASVSSSNLVPVSPAKN